jgi:hypothetical protein
MEIVRELRDRGYHGQVKFPVTGSRLLFGYDNIVLHGSTSSDVEHGIAIATEVLDRYGLRGGEARRGVDIKEEGGKGRSYTERLAQIVADYRSGTPDALRGRIDALRRSDDIQRVGAWSGAVIPG